MQMKRAFSARNKYIFASLFSFLGIICVIQHAGNYSNISNGNIFLKNFLSQGSHVSYNESDFLAYLRARFIDPPSSLPYNLTKFKKKKKNPSNFSGNWVFVDPSDKVFPAKVIQKLYPRNEGLKKGFFVEAGALDGEYLSNSLYLELELDWTGLLIEPSEKSYKKLRSKNRKVWSCHCCLEQDASPKEQLLVNRVQGKKSSYFNVVPGEVYDATGFLFNSDLHQYALDNSNMLQYEKVQCLPLRSILKALSVFKINLFSLDTEGSERGILESFPWDEVTVDVWLVEHFKFNENMTRIFELDQNFISWFESKGYDLYDTDAVSADYAFIRKNTVLTES